MPNILFNTLPSREARNLAYLVLVIRAMLVIVFKAVNAERKAEIIKLIVIANNTVRGHIGSRETLTGAAPKDSKRRIIDATIGAVSKSSIPSPRA